MHVTTLRPLRNIELPGDVDAVGERRRGRRTIAPVLYLNRPSLPTEDEQYEIYRKLRSASGRIR
jgi:phosphoenolpyruvate-protein kinase (PTS system EI component)